MRRMSPCDPFFSSLLRRYRPPFSHAGRSPISAIGGDVEGERFGFRPLKTHSFEVTRQMACCCAPASRRRPCRRTLYVVKIKVSAEMPAHTVAGWSSQVAREAHNLEVAGSNPVPANPGSCVNSLLLANPGNVRGFSCALPWSCEPPRCPACADCAAFCAAFSWG